MGLLRPFLDALRLSRPWHWWLSQWTDGWVHGHEEGEPCTIYCYPSRPARRDAHDGVTRPDSGMYLPQSHIDEETKDPGAPS